MDVFVGRVWLANDLYFLPKSSPLNRRERKGVSRVIILGIFLFVRGCKEFSTEITRTVVKPGWRSDRGFFLEVLPMVEFLVVSY